MILVKEYRGRNLTNTLITDGKGVADHCNAIQIAKETFHHKGDWHYIYTAETMKTMPSTKVITEEDN